MGPLPMMSMRQVAQTTWDAIVIGGGPAGALAAREAALSGLRTLLIEAKQFRRDKVCGGYLNSRALEALRIAGVMLRPTECPATEVGTIGIICGHQRVRFALPVGQVICRSAFDARLLELAADAGVAILFGTQAVVEAPVESSCRRVSLLQNNERESVRARVMVCADGLARSSTRLLPEFSGSIASASRIGLGAVVAAPDDELPPGQITMIISRDAYVGIAPLDLNRVNIAAAIVPSALAVAPPADVVAAILHESGFSLHDEICRATWRGTPALTSRPQQVAADRIFLIGDAAGYVEPFTGEGMASALESALAVTPLLVRAARAWDSRLMAAWGDVYRHIVCDRQQIMRRMAWTLRRRWAAAGMLAVCRIVPSIATRIIAGISTPSIIDPSPRMGVL